MVRVRDTLWNSGITVWTDENLTPGTSNWQMSIEGGIDGAKGLVVILSPDAKKSKWVREELGYAQNQGKKIFPLLARGNEKSAVPFGYSMAQWIDISENISPGMKILLQILQNDLKLGLGSVSRGMAKQKSIKTPRKKQPPARKKIDAGNLVGTVVEYYDQISVAGINLVDTVGNNDYVWFQGPETNFIQQVFSLELDRKPIPTAQAGNSIGMKVSYPVYYGDKVFVFQENIVGMVVHFYDGISVAGIELSGGLGIGDYIWIRGSNTSIMQQITSIEHDRLPVDEAFAGQSIGVKVVNNVEMGSEVWLLPDVRY